MVFRHVSKGGGDGFSVCVGGTPKDWAKGTVQQLLGPKAQNDVSLHRGCSHSLTRLL